MIERIKAFFETFAADGDKGDVPRDPAEEKRLASAALMVEAALMDEDFGDAERATILSLVRKRFGLSEEDGQALLAEAEKAVHDSNQWFAFTRTINDRFSHDERIELIEMMWEVAFADGVLHDFEENLIRRIGGLIYVSDRDRGEAKRRVAERVAAGPAEG